MLGNLCRHYNIKNGALEKIKIDQKTAWFMAQPEIFSSAYEPKTSPKPAQIFYSVL